MTQRELLTGLVELGISQRQIVSAMQAPGGVVEANERLDALKVEARRAFKRKALELHPDRTGDDEVKAEMF